MEDTPEDKTTTTQLFNLDDHADPANKEIIAATVEATESLDDVIKQINAKTSEASEL